MKMFDMFIIGTGVLLSIKLIMDSIKAFRKTKKPIDAMLIALGVANISLGAFAVLITTAR